MLPCGRGTVNWCAFMKKLKSTSYQGLFNFEVPGERCPVSRPIQLLKLKYALELGKLMFELA